MTLFNNRIRDIDVEISELNQRIKKLELEQKKMKERNAEVDKALKILGQVVEDYRSDEEVIFDLKHALSAMFLTPEELERIANSQGSEFHPDAIAKYERNGYQSETVEVGASEVKPEAEPKSEETQSEEPEKKSEPEPQLSASGSIILTEVPLEKIKRWDFSLSPDENRDREREAEPTPEPVQMPIKLANNATFHPSYQQLVMDFDTVEFCESLGNHAVKDWLCNEFSVLAKEGFYRLQLKGVQTQENAEAIIALAKSAPAEVQPEIEPGVDTNPPEPEPVNDDDTEFLTENMTQNSAQPFQLAPKTKEAEPNDVSFQFQSQGKGVWLVFAIDAEASLAEPIANAEKTQLAGVMEVGNFYRVPNLNNADFGTVESAAKALWEHHQQRQKVFANF